ncbi:hypothetical protein [Erythrobacter crassostreae]|uniref:Uncharacterized protein n=1 Tax=Erythrobacter crassostreae TaxID=2828328 RepID=A0A9X1F232_9SPHN|nr:hypothetical protein [Erythrobacter crassostrea]MBV7258882.1 hypothetical protein [Erythrobacter crassostrea]
MPVPAEKIIDLAERSGFASELKVASMLSAAGWGVDQSVYYIDKDEGVGRELDLYAYRIDNDISEKPEVHCLINFCIEVKKTQDPFVFFSSKARSHEGGKGWSMFRWSHNVDSAALGYKDIEREKPLSSPDRLARSYAAFKDGKTQQIRSGILSAVKAAIHYTEECDERWSDGSRDICFFLPIVVVDGDLFECYFETGSPHLQTKQVHSLVYQQNYISPHYGKISNSVLVYTMKGFTEALEDYANWGQDILETLQSSRSKVVKAGISRGGVSKSADIQRER